MAIHTHLIGLASLIVFLGSTVAQTPVSSTRQEVNAWSGKIEVTRNQGGDATIIILSSPDAAVNDRRAFVAQHANRIGFAMPAEWSGTGRVFVSEGVLAVAGDNGARSLFRFSGRTLPQSVARMFQGVKPYEVFGIAEHGTAYPLSIEEIQKLKAAEGCRAGSWAEASGAALPPFAVSPMSLPACTGCTSGGEGATSCTAGAPCNCQVSCGTGAACCNRNACTCNCCHPN
jgi:hypothetical protein